jgi:hypothetical protein
MPGRFIQASPGVPSRACRRSRSCAWRSGGRVGGLACSPRGRVDPEHQPPERRRDDRGRVSSTHETLGEQVIAIEPPISAPRTQDPAGLLAGSFSSDGGRPQEPPRPRLSCPWIKTLDGVLGRFARPAQREDAWLQGGPWMPCLIGVDGRDSEMGIYAAPPNRPREHRRASGVLGRIAVALAIASLATFALVGGAGAHSSWLVVALGEALLALVVLTASGPSRRSIDSYSRAGKTNEANEAPSRPAASGPRDAQLGTLPEKRQPRRPPVLGRRSRSSSGVSVRVVDMPGS